MLCQNCNINPATVFVHRIINGQEREFQLCSSCAKQFNMQISFDELFQGFLDTLLSHEQKQSFNKQNSLSQKKVCHKCGFTYDDFKSTGKLGCDECYKTFRSDLLAILKNIQGSIRHTGKVPQRNLSQMSFQNKITSLQNELRRAIDSEEYEEAARLRDEIKKLKGENNING